MHLILDLYIPGPPVPQPRARATVRAGHAAMYTPTTSGKGSEKRSNGLAEFCALVRKIAAEKYCAPLQEGALRVDCEFVFARTKGMTWKKKPMPRVPHVTRPDRDNLDKAVLDSLAGVVWRNDALVACGWLAKWYADGDEQPHTRIQIWAMEDGDGVWPKDG